ncbi:MAG: 16S rRNA (guanine(966)-N(2))-methyltransferase RsmD [Clostridium sp.]
MRIISGKYQKIPLKCMTGDNTRPTLDRIKETVFNILNNYIYFEELEKVVDLYAGSGALGIECISRGSRNVDFVDKNTEAYNIINVNIDNLKNLDKSKINIYNMDANTYLNKLKQEDNKADLFFLDPPFNQDISKVVEYILDRKLLSENGIIYYETDDEQKLLKIIEIINKYNLTILKQKKMGRINVLIVANIL